MSQDLAVIRESFRGYHHKHFQYVPSFVEYASWGWRLEFSAAFIFDNGEPDIRELLGDVYDDLVAFCGGHPDRNFEIKVSGGQGLTVHCVIKGVVEP